MQITQVGAKAIINSFHDEIIAELAKGNRTNCEAQSRSVDEAEDKWAHTPV